MTEHDTQLAIMQLITVRGGIATRVNSGAVLVKHGDRTYKYKGAEKGTSDIIALYRKFYLAIEVKYGDNEPTPAQRRFLEDVSECGGIAIVAYSSEDVETYLDEIDRISR